MMAKAFENNLNQDFKETDYPFCWLSFKDPIKEENPGAFYWNRLIDQKTGKSFLTSLAKEEEKKT